jgi:hypothetical protein
MKRPLGVGFRILGIVLALAAAPRRAPAQQLATALDADTVLVDQLYQVRLAQGPQSVLPALGQDTLVLLPVQALLRLAQVRVIAADSSAIAARIEPDGVTLRIARSDGRLERGDSARTLAGRDVAWRDGEMYLAPALLAWVLGVSIDIDRTELLVVVGRTEHLPVVRRRVRELQRQALRDPFGARPEIVDLESPRPLADGAVLDWSYLGAARDPIGTSTVQLALGTQTLGGGLEASVRHHNSAFDDDTDLRATWTGAWPAQRWLRQARVGDFFSGTRRSQVLQGFELSNAPYLRSAVFGAELLGGHVGAGWELDLLREGSVVGFTAADSTGAYELTIPVQYGLNPVEVEATGPGGERIRRTLLLVVPFDRLPARELEYTISGGRCRQGACGAALQSNVRYGLTSAITVEAGSDMFWRDSLPDLWAPYALVAASPLPVVHSTLEIVANGFARARAEYSPTPDLQVEAGHALYDTSIVQSPLGGGAVRQRSDLNVFWRPSAGSALIVQASGARARGRIGVRDEIGASLIAPLYGARVTGGLGWERSGTGDGVHGALRAHGSMDAVLRQGGWLGNTLVRAGFAAETDDGLTLLAASAGRRLSRLVRIDVGATWRHGVGTTLDLAFSSEFTGARVGSHSRYTTAEGLGGTQTAEGSMLWNARDRRVEFGAGRSLGRSGLVGLVFVDLDGNGTRDAGEPIAADVRLRVGSRAARSDSTGHFEAWDLIPFEPMTVEIDGSSLANPLWVPAIDGVRLTPRPNTVERVELPLAPAGELTGTVTIAVDGRSVGAIGVTLRHLSSGSVSRVVTFGDGTFYASGLRPGTYSVELSADALRELGLKQPPTRASVRPYDPSAGADVTIALEQAD